MANAHHASLGFTRAIAELVAGIDFNGLPATARIGAQHAMLDIIGVAIAGAQHPLLEPLRHIALAESGRSEAGVIGRNERMGVRNAALLNGSAAHVLDYDDVHTAMQGHPSAPLIPAVLALAESVGASGSDVMSAVVAGYEAAGRIGAAFGTDHYARGFHATATIGTFGAAAGCANLLKLDPVRTAHALGFAATQAAGLRAMFGTFGKPLHAGKAAESGLLAALLAAGGAESRLDAIEGRQGFAETHSGFFEPAMGLAAPASGYHVCDGLFKYHACCFDTHAAIDNIHVLSQQRSLALDHVARVLVEVDRSEDTVCNIQEPQSSLECKFSLRVTTAMALAGIDTGDPGVFTDALPADPLIRAWSQRITVDATGDRPPSSVRTVITLHSGEVIEASGNPDRPERDLVRQDARLRRKFEVLVAPVLGASRASRLAAAIGNAAHMSSGSLAALWTPVPASEADRRGDRLIRSGMEGQS